MEEMTSLTHPGAVSRLDPEVRTLVWPNGADFDPYVLHAWPRAVEQLAQRLRQPVVA